MRHHERQAWELALRRGDGGSMFYAHLECRRVAAGDRPPMARITLTDITEHNRAEVELRIAAVAFESQEGMFVTDARRVILRINRAFSAITGFTAEEAVGQTTRLLNSDRHDEVSSATMWEKVDRTGAWCGEIWNRQKGGEVSPRWLTITAVKGKYDSLTHYVGTLVDTHKLMFEFTESTLPHDLEETIAKMTAMRAHGEGLALDDFGTGYSSLSYLKRLPLDQLKIDQSFVRDVVTSSSDAAFARTIMALAQSLGLAVIAEGVETVEQRDFLVHQGCRAFQGYLFGRPGPVELLM